MESVLDVHTVLLSKRVDLENFVFRIIAPDWNAGGSSKFAGIYLSPYYFAEVVSNLWLATGMYDFTVVIGEMLRFNSGEIFGVQVLNFTLQGYT